MRIVITGATSMIGIALIKQCINNKCKVLAIVRNCSPNLKRLPKSRFIKLEYADLDSLDAIEDEEENYDVFYHLAWAYTNKVDRDNPFRQKCNISATLKAVNLAQKLGCKKFIGVGSQAEYGQKDGIITEDMPAMPTSAYGMAKFSAYMLSRKACEQYNISHVWCRVFSVYGPHDNKETMLSYAIDQFIKGQPAKFSAATQIWNYLYEDDAGRILFLLGIKNIKAGIYHVAGKESLPLKKYIEEMASIFGSGAICQFASIIESQPYGIEPSMKKTYATVGDIEELPFEHGIKIVIDQKMKNNYESQA